MKYKVTLSMELYSEEEDIQKEIRAIIAQMNLQNDHVIDFVNVEPNN